MIEIQREWTTRIKGGIILEPELGQLHDDKPEEGRNAGFISAHQVEY